MADTGARRFAIDHVINMTFGVIGRNIVPFFVLTLIAVLPQTILAAYFGQAAVGGKMDPATIMSSGFWLRFFGLQLLSVFLTFFLQATLTYWTVFDLRGARPSLGNALSIGVGMALPIFVVGILYVFGVAFGFLLLIVPGLMLLTAWTVVVPALVVERTGIIGCFGRSAVLTRGHRWPIFGILVVFYVGVYVIGLVALPISGLSFMTISAGGFPVAYVVFQTLLRIVTTVVGAAGSAAIYYELRVSKEGVGPEQLASVFD